MKSSKNQPVTLKSSRPLKDESAWYYFIIIAGVLFILYGGLFMMHYSVLLTLGCGFIIAGLLFGGQDSWVRHYTLYKLASKRFTLNNEINHKTLTDYLQHRLPANYIVEQDEKGNPHITRRRMEYTVTVNQDHTFSIIWKRNWIQPRVMLIGKHLTSRSYSFAYKAARTDYAIIAYAIQQYHHGQKIQSVQSPSVQRPVMNKQVAQKRDGMHYCPFCGTQIKNSSKFCIKCGKKQEPRYSQTVQINNNH